MGKINPPWSKAVDGDVTQLGTTLNCFSKSHPKRELWETAAKAKVKWMVDPAWRPKNLAAASGSR